ncbi:hypothetical protein C0J52_14445 [Blattella germanica]|nr:hypothetical protein C0J52_14445 [Blattella germanica]
MFCQYNVWVRPVKNYNETVNVTLRFVMQRIEFDEKSDILKFFGFFLMYWYDAHLPWKPSDFDNIDTMRVPSWYLWFPDIGVINYGPRNQLYFYGTCLVYSDGDVLCTPKMTRTASCSANLKYWPYDTHVCKMMLGSWTYSAEHLNLTLDNKPIEFENFNMNDEWKLTEGVTKMEVYKYSDGFNYPLITYEFLLERHSGSYAASVITPAVVLMLITLAIYWMEPSQSDRIILAAVNVASHIVFLQYLGRMLPPNGNETPLIVTFYRDSLILSAVTIVITSVIFGLRTSSQSIPLWATGISSWMLQNRFGQMIVFHNLDPKAVAEASEVSGEEGADLVNSFGSSIRSEWNTFTILLDFFCFTITLFVYFILLLGFIP